MTTSDGLIALGRKFACYADFVRVGNFTENERDAKFLSGLGLAGEAAEVAALTEKMWLAHMAAAGLGVRTGNVADILKKHLLHGADLDRGALVKELGDVFWYLQHTCNQFGITMEEVIEANVAKLCDRYPERYGSSETYGVTPRPGSGAR